MEHALCRWCRKFVPVWNGYLAYHDKHNELWRCPGTGTVAYHHQEEKT